MKMWTKGRPFPGNAIFFLGDDEVELMNYGDDEADKACVVRVKRLSGLDSVKSAKIDDLVVGVPTE
ncbi:MAG: hypothetical protein Q7N50_10740 [Armatimonadota bacterium]|nr:hypothetical protein [Armatimonadota bacterium]